MTNGGGAFSPEEVKYLQSLPAVAQVTPVRIIYTDDFKRYCIEHYEHGDSPVRMFRDAGLDPALIGYKRIERCIARWRNASGLPAEALTERSRMRGHASGLVTSAERGVKRESFDSDPGRDAPLRHRHLDQRDGDGLRDLLIAQQIRRINELERRVELLETMLMGGDAREPGPSATSGPSESPGNFEDSGNSGEIVSETASDAHSVAAGRASTM